MSLSSVYEYESFYFHNKLRTQYDVTSSSSNNQVSTKNTLAVYNLIQAVQFLLFQF